MYRSISQMEPMLPEPLGPFSDRMITIIRKSAALGGTLPAKTRQSVVDLLRTMNSYYSNRIEGHHTHLRDIERALQADYLADPARRALQLEARAHIEVQRLIEDRLEREARLNICGEEFLCWVHKEFYDRMPEEYRTVEDEGRKRHKILPGKIRTREVTVGRHIPPVAESIAQFLVRFSEIYDPDRLDQTSRIVTAAASHHRLAWIHPFLDGNGRVTRLFSDAYLKRVGISGHGLWVVSRGLARRRDQYLTALIRADAVRQGDLDGRGNLSNRGLTDFCHFFLTVCEDQIDFMTSILDLKTIERRIWGYIRRLSDEGDVRTEAGLLLRDVLLRGEIPRGEASRITGLGERTARKLLRDLLKKSLLVSDSSKGPVRLGFPTEVLGSYFPRLYPEGIEDIES